MGVCVRVCGWVHERKILVTCLQIILSRRPSLKTMPLYLYHARTHKPHPPPPFCSMHCVMCGTHFCWICGKVISNATLPAHFAFWNIFGCSGQQMDDRATQRSLPRKMLHAISVVLLVLPMMAVIGSVLFVLWLSILPLSTAVYHFGAWQNWEVCTNWIDFQLATTRVSFHSLEGFLANHDFGFVPRGVIRVTHLLQMPYPRRFYLSLCLLYLLLQCCLH